MKVFKFGGASVKDAQAIRNVSKVISDFGDDDLLVVVSAMGKTTNQLENLLNSYWNQDNWNEIYLQIKEYHFEILTQLFPSPHWVFQELTKTFNELQNKLKQRPSANYDFEYDQIVSIGELISSQIVEAYLQAEGFPSQWWDARDLIRTDNSYREAKLDWALSEALIQKAWNDLNFEQKLVVSQGFIGHTPERFTTTLGREGSDYSAAIFAWCLNAKSLTIWKDVPGMLNADPKWFDKTERLPEISYKEALELSYYGATVIHPKTIKPLQNKGIPLYVRSFLQPDAPGTIIGSNSEFDHLIPSFIFKVRQLLISIWPRDFSFMVEENLRDVFELFNKTGVKINLMQNSALDFSVCVDDDIKARNLLEELRKNYAIKFNENQELVTIRHYNQATIDRVLINKKVLLEQRTRQTLRMVISDENLN